jgi:hypothetical protein
MTLRGTAGRGAFPPNVVIAIKALACELPHEHGIPLSRFSMSELKREALARGIVASIGETTIWRWLSEDAIKPWNHRSWVFPRDPEFEAKAGRILDLYEGLWEGYPLEDDDWVICADEKTSIQARHRTHAPLPPGPRRAMRVEHEYEREGAIAYLAAWDVQRARVFGRCEARTGIQPFNRLVQQVMSQEPYCCARRVFWIVDNGSSHRGQASIDRLQGRWHNLVLVHTPVHASWLNQVEIYFSVLQRKVLTPNDFTATDEIEDRILRFQRHYEQVARPFQWKFTRSDLRDLMERLERSEPSKRLAA